MNHRIDPQWDMARLNEELEGATAAVGFYRRQSCLTSYQAARLAEWRDFEHQLRNRLTFVGLTAELDALEAKP